RSCVLMIIQKTKGVEQICPVQHLVFYLRKTCNRKNAVGVGCVVQIYKKQELEIIFFVIVATFIKQIHILKLFVKFKVIIVVCCAFLSRTFFRLRLMYIKLLEIRIPFFLLFYFLPVVHLIFNNIIIIL